MVPFLGSILFLDVFSGSGTVALGSSEKHFMEDYVASENFTKWSKKIGNLFKSCCCVRASDWKTYKDQGPTANFQIYMDDIYIGPKKPYTSRTGDSLGHTTWPPVVNCINHLTEYYLDTHILTPCYIYR